jgi:uncharacterized Zn-finger protein
MVVESMGRIAIIRPLPTIEDASSKMDGTAASPTEIIDVNDRTVACDGGDGALGHPRVFLYIEKHSVLCPYCSRLYVLNPGAAPARGH